MPSPALKLPPRPTCQPQPGDRARHRSANVAGDVLGVQSIGGFIALRATLPFSDSCTFDAMNPPIHCIGTTLFCIFEALPRHSRLQRNSSGCNAITRGGL